MKRDSFRLLAGLLVAVALAAACGALTQQSSAATAPTPPDTLVCVFHHHGGGSGAAEMALPIGGVYAGKWRSGEGWRRELPKDAKLTLYSLTGGAIGTLQLSGLVSSSEFRGFTGDWRLEGAGDLADLTYTGIEKSFPTGELALAVWRRGDGAVFWPAAKILARDDAKYLKLAREFFISRGLDKYLEEHKLDAKLVEQITIAQLLSADLDGDGKDEALISAGWSELAPPLVTLGTPGVTDWQCLLLVKTGEAGEQVVPLSFDDRSSFGEPEQVLGCVDLDSDGKAEVVTAYRLDPDEFRIYQWSPAKLAATYSSSYGE